jgi:hypothetical protein
VTDHPIHLEHLVGRVVRDDTGRSVGRIFDMRAEDRDGELVIVEYFLGPAAALARLGISVRALIGLKSKDPRAVSWESLDLSDPMRPRLRKNGDASVDATPFL